jgi:hypothetical protein
MGGGDAGRILCVANSEFFAQIVAIASLASIARVTTMSACATSRFFLSACLTTVAQLLRPGGARALVAESLLLRQQLLILNRSRKQAPNLNSADRVIAALCSSWIRFDDPSLYIRSVRPSPFQSPASGVPASTAKGLVD